MHLSSCKSLPTSSATRACWPLLPPLPILLFEAVSTFPPGQFPWTFLFSLPSSSSTFNRTSSSPFLGSQLTCGLYRKVSADPLLRRPHHTHGHPQPHCWGSTTWRASESLLPLSVPCQPQLPRKLQENRHLMASLFCATPATVSGAQVCAG